MRARCPCSSANLGPGFDALALALNLYVEVTIESADALSITTVGEGADFPQGRDHMSAGIVRDVLGHDDVAITIRSEIPVARGLGSSAALAAATAAAAGAADPLAVATRIDGHAENAAASVIGGLVVGTVVDGVPVVEQLPIDDRLALVVVIPDRMLSTRAARAALPDEVPLHDAAANLGRMGLLVAGLARADHFSRHAMQDLLHQPYRIPLFPESETIMRGLVEAGALGACWSGAGSTLLAVALGSEVGAVLAAGAGLLEETAVRGRALHLEVDRTGLVVGD
ncbi:MAG TPA: homoserine kinase [Acidimicrobiales bacterium]|nr:homoserine kinase [Acidimicrobiales bacterium]